MREERWIVIPNWREFQHYHDRQPHWIKLYTRLLDDPDYLALSFRLRGILAGIWMLYAASDGLVRGSSPAQLGSRLGLERVRTRDLVSLNDAGFITFSASKPLALRYQTSSLEREKRINPPTPLTGTPPKPDPKPKRQRLPFAAMKVNGTAPDEHLCPSCHVGAGLHSADCVHVADPDPSPFDDTAPDPELEYADFGAMIGET